MGAATVSPLVCLLLLMSLANVGSGQFSALSLDEIAAEKAPDTGAGSSGGGAGSSGGSAGSTGGSAGSAGSTGGSAGTSGGDAGGSCSAPTSIEGCSSLLMDAGATGSIRYKPVRFYQSFQEDCHTEEAQKYRTADGSCNHVFGLGTANTPFKRLLPPAYGDLKNSPRTHGKNGTALPRPTDLSATILTNKDEPQKRTTMFMQWAQFIDHDITLTPVPGESGEEIHCCGPDATFPDYPLHPECFPMKLSEGDADVRFRGNCMEFVRSVPARTAQGYQQIPREQINELTSFLDGSMIYGSSVETQLELRKVNADGEPGAEMRTFKDSLLPVVNDSDCLSGGGVNCFLAGDVRANVQPGLTAIHTQWVRLHNLVVDGLRPHLSDASDEELFQEARKIVVAILQKIHYREFMPLVIGTTLQGRYRLWPSIKEGHRVGYSSFVDPRIGNSFATAAFRYGHSLLPEHLVVNGKAHRFRTLFFKPDLIFEDFDAVVAALLNLEDESNAQTGDRHLVEEITAHLFEPDDHLGEIPSRGLDLGALNIQRGRDHGIPPYNKFRKFCGLEPVRDFAEFGEVAEKMKALYSSVDDVDLFVGGLVEEKESSQVSVGPTFACIIAQQFHALKFGDKFYFETDRMPGGFTDKQLQEIRKSDITFSLICCLTTDLERVPRNAFIVRDDTVKCNDIRENFLNFSLWKTV